MRCQRLSQHRNIIVRVRLYRVLKKHIQYIKVLSLIGNRLRPVLHFRRTIAVVVTVGGAHRVPPIQVVAVHAQIACALSEYQS